MSRLALTIFIIVVSISIISTSVDGELVESLNFRDGLILPNDDTPDFLDFGSYLHATARADPAPAPAPTGPDNDDDDVTANVPVEATATSSPAPAVANVSISSSDNGVDEKIKEEKSQKPMLSFSTDFISESPGKSVHINGTTFINGDLQSNGSLSFFKQGSFSTESSVTVTVGTINNKSGVFVANTVTTAATPPPAASAATPAPTPAAPADLHFGVAKGGKIHFGDGTKDFSIDSDTESVTVQGKLSVNDRVEFNVGGQTTGYFHVKAENATLRVGAAWGMPGIYSGDDGNKDLILGAPAGNKIYFGVGVKDAYVEAGTGNAVFSGNVTGKSGIFDELRVTKNFQINAAKVPLSVGASSGTPGISASDSDVAIGVSKGRNILFGVDNKDAYIVGGTGDFVTNGDITTKGNLRVQSYSDFYHNTRVHTPAGILRAGSSYKMPGIYAKGNSHLSLGVKKGQRVYIGVGTKDAFFSGGEGSLTLSGTVNAGGAIDAARGGRFGDNILVISEKQELRVGSAWGIGGIYSQNDIVIGTQTGRKVYFGNAKSDSFVESGSGMAFFRGDTLIGGNLQTNGRAAIADSLTIASGKVVSVISQNGIVAQNGSLSFIVPKDKKLFFGTKNEVTIDASTGNITTLGTISTSGISAPSATFAEQVFIGTPATSATANDSKGVSVGIEGISGSTLFLKSSRVDIGAAREEVYITAGGNGFFKGNVLANGELSIGGILTAKKSILTEADGTRLRLGAVWGMPGLFASEGEDRDMVIGTAEGKKIYFGFKQNDAYIRAGSGDAWFKGSCIMNKLSVGSGATIAGGLEVRQGDNVLTIGASDKVPSISSPNGVFIQTAASQKIFFGATIEDSFVEAGTGRAVFRGSVETATKFKAIGGADLGDLLTIVHPTTKATLQVGLSSDGLLGGLYVSGDALIATGAGKKIYFGRKTSSWIDSDSGNVWFKGSVFIGNQIFINTSNPEEPTVAPTQAATSAPTQAATSSPTQATTSTPTQATTAAPSVAPSILEAIQLKTSKMQSLSSVISQLQEENNSLKSRLDFLEDSFRRLTREE